MTPNKLKPYSEWSDEELKKALSEITDVMGDRTQKRKKEKKRTLNINGITVKDFVVIYAPWDIDEVPSFSFYILHDGKLHDLHEDKGAHDFSKTPAFNWHPWWPTVDENEKPCCPVDRPIDDVYNAAYAFIPSGFCESCENCYEYSEDTAQALKVLKEHGFEVVIEATFEDQGYYDEVYANWIKQHDHKSA